jgi:hypothetical protein
MIASVFIYKEQQKKKVFKRKREREIKGKKIDY